jgi:hypothetical protein
VTRSTPTVEPDRPLPQCEIDFRFHDDRHGHVILIRLQNEVLEILESVEGTDDDEWPPSPPLQQIHEQELPSGSVIWGLGMSGSSHWSGSFAFETDGHSDTRRLHAELALRSDSRNADAVSTYRVIDPKTTVNKTTETSLEVSTQLSALKISVDLERAQLEWIPERRLLTVRPRVIPESTKVTQSWDYYLGATTPRV